MKYSVSEILTRLGLRYVGMHATHVGTPAELTPQRQPRINLLPRSICNTFVNSFLLLIRQLIIVALRGILREVLHEFPIVAFGIVEVPALAVRMCVWRRGLSESGRLHSLA
jgi:hypothetical protein